MKKLKLTLSMLLVIVMVGQLSSQVITPVECFNQSFQILHQLSKLEIEHRIAVVHSNVEEKANNLKVDFLIEVQNAQKTIRAWSEEGADDLVCKLFLSYLDQLVAKEKKAREIQMIDDWTNFDAVKKQYDEMNEQTDKCNRLQKQFITSLTNLAHRNNLIINKAENKAKRLQLDSITKSLEFNFQLSIFDRPIHQALNAYINNLTAMQCEKMAHNLTVLKDLLSKVKSALGQVYSEGEEQKRIIKQFDDGLALTTAFTLRNFPENINVCRKKVQDKSTYRDINMLNTNIDAINEILIEKYDTFNHQLSNYLKNHVPKKWKD